MSRSIWNRCLCLSAGVAFLALALAADYSVELRDGAFILRGWVGGSQPPAAGWQSVFPVYAGSAATPMLGTYVVDGDALVFHPRFPIEPDASYHGTFPGGGFALDPGPARPASTRVEYVHPSADVLPANTLRMYIVFSAPMSAGDALRHVRLLDSGGNALPDSFLDQELWDPDHRRLTLLLDPGRIKRWLVPAKEAGTPIVENSQYTLAIDRDWRDARGAPLVVDFQKRFTGGPAVRTAADPAGWRIEAPAAGTVEPLVVKFSRPMDYALLQRTLGVSRVAGKIAVAQNETEWRFTPDAPWKAGAATLTVDRDLEDICGNRTDWPFDVDLRTSRVRKKRSGPITISFRVR